MPGDRRHRQRLLSIARAAVVARVRGLPDRPPDPPPDPSDPPPAPHSGVFVSLHRHGELRGCIGTLDASLLLDDAVADAAVAACSADPRFPPLTEAELGDVVIEISVLGPSEPVRDFEEIDVGRHGLIVEQGPRRGLLLPQVASQWGWTRHQFVAQACRKAGLREDAWRHGALVCCFEADVFGEP